MMIDIKVYESAVQGRQIFRSAYSREREKVRRLRETLIAVRSDGIVAGAAFMRRNDDGADRCADVLNRIDAVLSETK